MSVLYEQMLRWLLDASATALALFSAAAALLLVVRQPAKRRGLITWTLAAGIILAAGHAFYRGQSWSLGIFDIHAPRALPWLMANGNSAGDTAATSRGIIGLGPELWLRMNWPTLLIAGYVTMGIVLLLRAGLGAWWLGHLRGSSRPLPAAPRAGAGGRGAACVRVSAIVTRPVIFGVWRPVILLPERLIREATADEIRIILAHEQAHLSGGDLPRRLLAVSAGILFFPLPPLWVLLRTLHLSQEQLADHAAARGDPIGYAELLLRLAGGGTGDEAALGAWRRPSETRRRIGFLLKFHGWVESRCTRAFSISTAAVLLIAGIVLGNVTLTDTSAQAQVRTSELRGVSYLLQRQESSGGWITRAGPAPTALVVRSLLQAGVPVNHPALLRARNFLDGSQQPDGGFYRNSAPTYQTAVVLSLYSALNDDDARSRLREGRQFLETVATMSGENEGNPGTAQYVNDTYGPESGWNWHSLAYADLRAQDARATQAARWLAQRWTVTENPGARDAGQEGHYYFLMAAARTLQAARPGALPQWRTDINQWLLAHQEADGSWVNHDSARWLEDQPELVTAYALLAIQATR